MGEKLNAAVFIDYENVHFNFINQFKNVFELDFFRKLKQFLNEKDFNVVDTVAYCNYDIADMHLSFHQTKLHQLGIDTRHTTNNGKNYADLQITADVLDLVHTNETIDCIILISNDKDMTPLIKSVKKTNVSLVLILFKDLFDRVLLEYPNSHYFIEDIIKTKVKGTNDFKDEVFGNIETFVNKKIPTGATTPFLWSLDKCLESISAWFKVFEYEIVRNLSLLEQENKIFAYKYKIGTNPKEFIGISTNTHSALYVSSGTNTITKVTNYFSTAIQEQTYKKYSKN